MTSRVQFVSSIGEKIQNVASALVGSPLFWVAFLCVPFGWPIYKAVTAPIAPALPVFGGMPSFSLLDQESREVGERQLAGIVWVGNFLSSTDDPESQAVAHAMGEIQYRARNLGAGFGIVTFGENPVDTPGSLLSYATKNHVSPRSWHLLTKAPPAVRAAAVQALEAHQGGKVSPEDEKKIDRGTLLILVDQLGRIRGTYEGSLEAGRDALLHDAGLLVNRGS